MRNNSDEAQLVQKELREGKTPRRTNTRAQHNRYHQEHKKTKTKTQNRQNQSPKPRSSPNVHPNPGANPGAPGCVQKPQNLIKPLFFQHFAPPNPGANPGASKTSRKAAHNKKPPSSLFLYSGKCSLIHHANPKVRPHPSFSGVDLLDLVQKRTHCCLLRFKRLVLNFRESSSTTTGTQSPSGTPCHCVRLIMCACLCLFHVCFERMTSEA